MFTVRFFNSKRVLNLMHSIVLSLQELETILATRDEDKAGCLQGLVLIIPGFKEWVLTLLVTSFSMVKPRAWKLVQFRH